MKFQRLTSFQHLLMNAADDGGSGGGGAADDKKDNNQPGAGDDNKGKAGPDPKKEEKKEFDISSLPQEAQDLIKSLRGESAKHRTDKNNLSTRLEKLEKGLKSVFGDEEDDSEDADTKLQRLTGMTESLQARNAILSLAIDNGISGAESIEYFEFLMAKKLESLEEGEELEEEAVEEILGKVKKKGAANTSVDDKGTGSKKASGGDSGEVTMDQFMAMGILQKSKLFQEKPDVYNRLMAESKKK